MKELSELYKYYELPSSEQIAIHQVLISYVRQENCLFNIHMVNGASAYNLVKLKSINFENQYNAIWIHFETITGDRLGIPIDFLSKIEISGQENI